MPENPLSARPRRKNLMLVCSKCSKRVPVQAHEDPNEGDGWPLHRCGLDVRPFDSAVPDDRPMPTKYGF